MIAPATTQPFPSPASRRLSVPPVRWLPASLARLACAVFLLLLASGSRGAAEPGISLDKSVYQPGEAIAVTFTNGPGLSTDWIGLYPPQVVPSGNPPSLLWFYTNGTRTSGGSATDGTVSFMNPTLAPGTYHAWFLTNDGYGVLAGPVAFTVESGEDPVWRVDRIRPRHAVAGQAYRVALSAYATDPGGTRVFSKADGPAWLDVSGEGILSGTPGPEDVGLHASLIRLSGGGSGPAADIEVNLEVFAPGQESVSRLAVMSYNTWHAWNQVNGGYQKGLDSIVRSGADLIGFQESSNSHAQQVAEELGWFRAESGSGSTQIISRYPIVETFTAGSAVAARVRLTETPLREVILFNCHLDYRFYGPYAAEQEGATEASVLAEEARSERLPQIRAILQEMQSRISAADDTPVLLTGDFNVPSHLDWTAAAAGAHHGVGPVQWPVSTEIETAGLIDSLRSLHPDPSAVPAITWSPIQKGTEPQDRIDFIYHKGRALRPLAASTFTTEVETIIGRWGDSIDPIKDNTWPSDHAAVLITYAIRPPDGDGNGLSDAWEQRWFQRVGNSPEEDVNGNGLSNHASMLLGIPPVGAGSPPLQVISAAPAPPQLAFPLSDLALGQGVVIEKSKDLDQWSALWAFDEDPFFQDPAIREAIAREAQEWNILLHDSSAAPGDRAAFYRINRSF